MSIRKTNTGISATAGTQSLSIRAPQVYFVATQPVNSLAPGAFRHVTFDSVTQSQLYSGWANSEFTVPVNGVYVFNARLLATVNNAGFGTLGYHTIVRLNVTGSSDDIRLHQDSQSGQTIIGGQTTLVLQQSQRVRLEVLVQDSTMTLTGGYYSEFSGVLAQDLFTSIPPAPSDFGNVYFVARNPTNVSANTWSTLEFGEVMQSSPQVWFLNREFRAPKNGVYTFHASLLSTVVNNTGFGTLGYRVRLRLNVPGISDDIIIFMDWQSGQTTVSGQATLTLSQNQYVTLQMHVENSNAINTGGYYSQFSGILVEEL